MTKDMRAVLLEQRAKTEDLQREFGIVIPYVFHDHGKPFKDYQGARKTACSKACLPGRIPHDFRRNGCSKSGSRWSFGSGRHEDDGAQALDPFLTVMILLSQGDLNDAAPQARTSTWLPTTVPIR